MGLYSKIEPITLNAACKRLGHWLDLWYTNPNKAMKIIESRDPDKNPFPLCGLFEPQEAQVLQDVDNQSDDESPAEEFDRKKQVKAPLPELFREMETNGETHHVESMGGQQRLHRAHVSMESFKVQWDGYTREQIHDLIIDKYIKEASEKVHHASEHDKRLHEERLRGSLENAARDMRLRGQTQDKELQEYQEYIAEKEEELCALPDVVHHLRKKDGLEDVLDVLTTPRKLLNHDLRPLYLMLAMLTILMIPDLCMLQRKDLCEGTKNRITSFLCEDDGLGLEDSYVFDQSFGELTGVISLVASLALVALCKLCYWALRKLSPEGAKLLRKSFLNLFLDQFLIGLLPNVHDHNFEKTLLALLISLYFSGFAVAFVMMSPGVLSFAHVCVYFISRIANFLIGDPVGVQSMRELRIFQMMDQHRKVNHIRMSQEELRFELLEFLSTPSRSDIVKVSLPFLALMAHAIYIEQPPDSARIGKFIVAKAYAEYSHPRKRMASLRCRKDVIVDVFCNACQVPHHSLKGERWQIDGKCWLPWYLALLLWKVPEIEMKLRLHNLSPGVGCFGWRSTRNGLWAAREAEDVQTFQSKIAELSLDQEGVNIALPMMVLDPNVTEVHHVKPLIEAKANVNYSYVGETALFRAARTGKMSIAKELVRCGANVRLKCERHDDLLPIDLFPKEKDKTHFREFLRTLNITLEAESLQPCPNADVIFFPVAAQDASIDNECGEVFPYRLGPFRLARTEKITPKHIKLKSTSPALASGRLEWWTHSSTVEALIGSDVRLDMGKISAVTIQNEPSNRRKNIGIPRRATHFAWCAPVRDKNLAQFQCLLSGVIEDPDFCFLKTGGFVYFTKDDQDGFHPVQINALLSGKSSTFDYALSFDLPQEFTAKDFFAQMGVVRDQFHPTTLHAKSAGYSKVCWVHKSGGSDSRNGFAYMSAHCDHGQNNGLAGPDSPDSVAGVTRSAQVCATQDKNVSPTPLHIPPVEPLPRLSGDGRGGATANCDNAACLIQVAGTLSRGHLPPPLPPPLQPPCDVRGDSPISLQNVTCLEQDLATQQLLLPRPLPPPSAPPLCDAVEPHIQQAPLPPPVSPPPW